MQKTQIDPATIRAIESVLSKGERAVIIPMEDGGVRVQQSQIRTVYVQNGTSTGRK